MTENSAILYDTHHTTPIAAARGLHYSGLTAGAWTPDGHHLLVSSMDGYISILSFGDGELGKAYKKAEKVKVATPVDKEPEVPKEIAVKTLSPKAKNKEELETTVVPKEIAVISPKKRTCPQYVSPIKPGAPNTLEAQAVQVVTVLQPKKKKKRATLTLVRAVDE